MRQIAIYGKGGIGKSTTTCNLSAALAADGFTVMQIGCDPKADSTRLLLGGDEIPTVLDKLRESSTVSLDDIVYRAPCGVLCVEAGGPVPGIGCAGRGIITAFEQLEALAAYEVYKPDFVFYDVLGDVVCGGFAMPLRRKYAQKVFIVSSAEAMSLYAASNIMNALDNFKTRGYAHLAGIIANKRGGEDEDVALTRFAQDSGTPIIAEIPYSPVVKKADERGALVIEAYPDSEAASSYGALARFVEDMDDE